jgi:hypothetical protein
MLLATSLLCFVTSAIASEKAGVSAGVRGNVELSDAEQDGRDLSIGDSFEGGEDIYLGDLIESQSDSGMQIILLDETTITIGPESDLTIDEFYYDPETTAGELSAEATKGMFRFVSGNVTQNNPDATTFNLRSGTMGVRGTMVLVSLDEPEGVLVINLGPGTGKEASNDKMGVVEVTGPKGSATLEESGMSSFLSEDGYVSDPEKIDPDRLADMLSQLSQRESGTQKSGRGSSSGSSGETSSADVDLELNVPASARKQNSGAPGGEGSEPGSEEATDVDALTEATIEAAQDLIDSEVVDLAIEMMEEEIPEEELPEEGECENQGQCQCEEAGGNCNQGN